MKKFFAIALVAAAVSFAACGSGETKPEETPAPDSPKVEAPVAVPDSNVTVAVPDSNAAAAATPAAPEVKVEEVKK
jgi:hypothetical protein